MMGRGHLGIVPLPSTGDSFEQPQLNFYSGLETKGGKREIDSDYREIKLLVFGGARFKEREPNEDDFTDMCLMLTITSGSDMYELKYLPGAKLRCPDKFFGNMQARCDLN